MLIDTAFGVLLTLVLTKQIFMKKILLLVNLIAITFFAFSQTGIIKGVIKDKKTNETIIGASVSIYNAGVITDVNGNYELKSPTGKITVSYNFIGYKDVIKNIVLHDGETVSINVFLLEQAELISEVVVSAGKFEQKLSDVTVSMEVIKPSKLESNNTKQMDEVIKQIPGVDVMDGQVSIRGGSGYSYGAGSRVLILVDDLPMLSPDVGDAKWNYIPVENISQIEVIKGAASALFGSSALNGAINFRTAFPKDVPETKITTYTGVYMNPKREELIWWGETQPIFTGISALHSRKIGNLDLVIGGNAVSDKGYRENNHEEHARFNTNLRYRDKKIKGLSYGVNANVMKMDKTDFFLWQDADSGAYKQNTAGMSRTIGMRGNVDPFVTYLNKKGDKLSIRTRYFRITNEIPSDSLKESASDMYYSEFQYQKRFSEKLTLTSGLTYTYAETIATLFGNHYSTNAAAFGQADYKIKKLTLSGGLRAEYYKIDNDESIAVIKGDTIDQLPVMPVFRMGANYKLAEYTFLRASYGQGYRFPTIAEKYTSTSVSALKIFPNPNLIPETGWSAELGLKQGIKVSEWNGYFDIAGFWTEYKNMMEFVFGVYDLETYAPIVIGSGVPITLDNFGFQSQNVGHARIVGIDATVTGAGKLFGIPTTLLLGYTYTNPVDLSWNPEDTTIILPVENNILKYRSYHSVKGDIEFNYNKLSTGLSFIYSSQMINIDRIFEEEIIAGIDPILPGLKEYREENNNGYYIIDYRVSYQVTEFSKLSIIVKNILNEEYMGRPGDIRPPRNVALQYVLKF